MLLACSSTSDRLIAQAIRDLAETTMLHVQEILNMPSAALSRFLEINREAGEEKVIAYETHSDVWPYLRGQNVGVDFNADPEKWIGSLASCVTHCLENRNGLCITVLAGQRGPDETFQNLAFLFYSLGVKVINATLWYERQDLGETVVESCPIPCGYDPKLHLGDPDILILLLIHSLLSEGRTIKGLSNVGQIRDMLMKTKLTRYLPAKKGERNADGYYKALKRTSKKLVNCNMLTRSNVRRKDEYSITGLGMSCLKLARLLPPFLGSEGRRIITDYEKIAKVVTSYEREP